MLGGDGEESVDAGRCDGCDGLEERRPVALGHGGDEAERRAALVVVLETTEGLAVEGEDLGPPEADAHVREVLACRWVGAREDIVADRGLILDEVERGGISKQHREAALSA